MKEADDPPSPFGPLMADDAFRTSVLDDGFASATYAAFAEGRFSDAGEARFTATWRTSAAFVAAARDKGESYLDFYGRHEGDADDARVAAALSRHGWRALTTSEVVEEHDAVVDMVRRSLGRQLATHPSDWASRLVHHADTHQGSAALGKKTMVKARPKSLWDEARFAAFDGKLSQAEWRMFASRLAFDVEHLRETLAESAHAP